MSDAISLVRLIAHRARQGNFRQAIIYLDCMKAFDSVDHAFTYRILEAAGIPPEFIKWVRMALEGSVMRLINGFLTESFPMLGGGKQGDPLYPYLFIIVMLGLEALFHTDPTYHGITIPGCDAPQKTVMFADDVTAFVGHDGDAAKALAKQRTHGNATGLFGNNQKNLIQLCGSMKTHPPPGYTEDQLGINIITEDEPALYLGIYIGPINAASLNARKAVDKVRRFTDTHLSNELTLAGLNLLANACAMGCTTFAKLNSFFPKQFLDEERSLVNHFTSGRGPSSTAGRRHMFSYRDKCTPPEMGGPLTTLLPIDESYDALTAARIFKLANERCTQSPWACLVIDQIYTYAVTHGIYTVDHALSSDLRIRRIATHGNRYTHDALTLRGLQGYINMGFRRALPSTYESTAELNIFRNWHIVDAQGKTFCSLTSGSPFRFLRQVNNQAGRPALYHVGQMFDNYDIHDYRLDPRVLQGDFFTNAELNTAFASRPIPDQHWDELKASITNTGLTAICRAGTTDFVVGEFVAVFTLEPHPNGDSRYVGDRFSRALSIFCIEAGGYIRRYTQEVDRPTCDIILEPTNDSGRWGDPLLIANVAFHYPLKCKVRRVLTCSHFHRSSRKVQIFLIGYPFVHVTHSDDITKTQLWRRHRLFGLHHGDYQCLAGYVSKPTLSFKEVSRAYRRHGFDPITTHFAGLEAAMPHVDWHKKSRALKHARVTVKVKNFIHRLITGKLYLGDWAYTYLSSPAFNQMPNHIRDSFHYCPYCIGHVVCTADHQFWLCPKLQAFRDITLQMQTRLGAQPPVVSLTDLVDFLDINNNTDIKSVITYEIVFNSLYAIWITYINKTVPLVQDFLSLGDGAPLQLHIDSLTKTLTTTFHNLIRVNVSSLPLHVRSVKVLDSFDRIPSDRKGVSVKYRDVQAPLIYNLCDLTPEMIQAYNDTWCSVPDYVEIVVGLNGSSFLVFKPLRSGVPSLDDGRVRAGGRQLGL